NGHEGNDRRVLDLFDCRPRYTLHFRAHVAQKLPHATERADSRTTQAALAASPFAFNALAEAGGAWGRSARILYIIYIVHKRNSNQLASQMLAGVPGFEPGLSVLETDVLTVDTIPLCQFPNAEWRMPISRPILNPQSEIGNRQSLLRFFMISVLTATAAELAELKP